VGVDPVPEHTEKLIVHSLLSSIKNMLDFNVDCDPITNRLGANSNKECNSYVVVGGEHAEGTSEALNQLGVRSTFLSMPHYRSSAIHLGKIKEGLDTLDIKEETIFVMQVFDSGMFAVRTDEGGLIPPCRRADGTVHIDGALEIINHGSQYDLFRQLTSELVGRRNNKLIFLAPLPRYLEAGCCGDQDHVSNRNNGDYKVKQIEGIFQTRQHIKNFAFRQGLRNCATVSTWGKVRHLEKIWESPTKLVGAGYKRIAEAVLEAEEEMGKKRRASEVLENVAKKPRPAEQTGNNGARPTSAGNNPPRRGQRGGRGDRGQRGRAGVLRDGIHSSNRGRGSHHFPQHGNSDPREHRGGGRGGRGGRWSHNRGSRRGFHGRAGGY
jgi:hypothetical protein